MTAVTPSDWVPRVGDVFDTLDGDRTSRYFVTEALIEPPPLDTMLTRYTAKTFRGYEWHFDDPRQSSRDSIRVVPPDERTMWDRVVVAQLVYDDHDLKIAVADGVDPSPLDTVEGQMLAEFLGGVTADEFEHSYPQSLTELIELVAEAFDRHKAREAWRDVPPTVYGTAIVERLAAEVARVEDAVALDQAVAHLVREGWHPTLHRPDDPGVWCMWSDLSGRGVGVSRHGGKPADPDWPSIPPTPVKWTAQAHLNFHHSKPTNAEYDSPVEAFQAALDLLG